ncbi:KAP family P-loop domain-containing protein [Clostridium acidisoli DSM 12555]|uniref:KAP family P-loop domain-containing protein n=1 Tax=Clostridium acidisoli DSM 12555 TaxID=1121291 RepID=A0A1W1XA91_9CLOT|nr:P-loop NTPase fold protein [Clostridium acidisoli]SMC20872.1 KAP family P-loop domain-containing protein [Clostridium acidisoli DSM 12555]
MNEFNKDCTFDHDDVLNRRNFANNLTQIIKEGNKYTFNNSLVIALDSPWCTGKTTFINKWISAIREDKIGNEKMEIIHYNAWDNDDWNEPLVSLLNELETHLKYIAKKEEIISDLKKTSIRLLKYMGKNVTQNLIKKKIRNRYGRHY